MEVDQLLSKLNALETERHAYEHAMNCLSYDDETVAPRDSAKGRSETMGVLSQRSFEIFVNDEVRGLLDELWAQKDELDEKARRRTELLREELDQMTRIPMDEYVAFSQLLSESGSVWRAAKEANDFASFQPYLERVVDTQRRFAGYMNPNLKPYDALLDNYEKDMRAETLDAFFSMLRTELVPLLERVKSQPAEPAFVSAYCPVDKQRALSKYLMDLMGLDPNRTVLGEVEHPFTSGFNNRDVRITTHYYEHAALSSMYSVIHEGGHALYELGIGDDLQSTCLCGVSMGLHESQSRLYENLIGHDRGFIGYIAPKLRELFGDVSDDALYRAVNRVTPSLVRTEADEVTYPLHIMVRYELEKRLMDGTLAVSDLPQAWNDMYREYLGITPPTDTLGVLQDTHWAGGMIGYFPTYALGSAYASQFMHAMQQELDVPALLAKGDLKSVTEWLRSHIHQYGALYKPAEMVKKASGEDFNPSYYVKHLCQVIEDVYGK